MPAAAPDDEYVLRVGAAPNAGVHATGNYKLAIVFGGRAVELIDFATGVLSAAAPVELHALYVGQSQLLHLLLDLSTAGAADGVWATIYDAAGGVRERIAAQGGDARSANPVLLEPGAYTVQVSGVSLVGASLGEVAYRLRGAVISDPLGPILHDPTFDPIYLCPGQSDVYCYPGGAQSPSPYLWSDFIQSEPSGQAPTDPSDLFDNWWNWFWSLQPGDTNGDQSVDIGDLNNVRNNFGESGYAPLGDTDGNGAVTLEDLNRVRNNFGASQEAPAAAPLVLASTAQVPRAATPASPSAPAKAVDAVFATYLSGSDAVLARRRARLR